MIPAMSTIQTSRRPIDNRFVPPVAGIDLEQSLNYLDMDVVGESFVYDHYTSRHLFHVPGARPALDRAAALAVADAADPMTKAQRLAQWVADNVKWAGFHEMDKGLRLADNLKPTEEALLAYGYGWCNEQARLFCFLAQTQGLPARIVFACNKTKHYGHCISEVLLDQDWMAVDQSMGFCFAIQGAPIRAARIIHDQTVRAHFTPIYTKMCRDLYQQLGPILDRDFTMSVATDPLDGFTNLGFHNYYLHA
jgi:hypothetical protein